MEEDGEKEEVLARNLGVIADLDLRLALAPDLVHFHDQGLGLHLDQQTHNTFIIRILSYTEIGPILYNGLKNELLN